MGNTASTAQQPQTEQQPQETPTPEGAAHASPASAPPSHVAADKKRNGWVKVASDPDYAKFTPQEVAEAKGAIPPPPSNAQVYDDNVSLASAGGRDSGFADALKNTTNGQAFEKTNSLLKLTNEVSALDGSLISTAKLEGLAKGFNERDAESPATPAALLAAQAPYAEAFGYLETTLKSLQPTGDKATEKAASLEFKTGQLKNDFTEAGLLEEKQQGQTR